MGAGRGGAGRGAIIADAALAGKAAAAMIPTTYAYREDAMALMDFIKKQFIDIIAWTEDAADAGETMAWRFPMADFEIQYGASLTVTWPRRMVDQLQTSSTTPDKKSGSSPLVAL